MKTHFESSPLTEPLKYGDDTGFFDIQADPVLASLIRSKEPASEQQTPVETKRHLGRVREPFGFD